MTVPGVSERVQTLGPHDIIVFESDRFLTASNMQRLRDRAVAEFGSKQKILVLDKGIEMKVISPPNIEIRSCDDWIAVYKDGKKVWENHSCPLRQGLEALGIPFIDRDLDAEDLDVDTLMLPDGSEAFPETLP